MRNQNTIYRIVAAIVFCFTASLTSVVAVAEEQRPIVIMDTFDVHANAVGFFELMERAIKLAKEVDPKGSGRIDVLAVHPEPDSASTVIVFTTYPSMDAYVANTDALKNSEKMQAINQEMKDGKFVFVTRTVNTVVSRN